jgi:hypothetical protein
MTCSRHPKRAQSRASRLLWLFGTSRAREGLLASQRGVSPLVRPGALSPVQGLRPTPGRRRKARSASGLLVWPVAWPRLLGERPPLFPALEGRLPETIARRPLGPNRRNHGNAGTALSLVLRRLKINDQCSVKCPLLALSGHFWTARRMSAFVGKADISRRLLQCLLMALNGRRGWRSACPLSALKRTSIIRSLMSANDP